MRNPASPDLRLLYPRDALTGVNGDALGNLIVDELPDGAVCVVPGTGLYVLEKSSTDAVSSPTVIATGRGAAAPGRWVQFSDGTPSPTNYIVVAKVIPVHVPVILDGASANVVVAGTDVDFENCDAVIMLLSQGEVISGLNPPDNLAAPYAWISNPPVGQITCRFSAVGGVVPDTLDVNFLFLGIKFWNI